MTFRIDTSSIVTAGAKLRAAHRREEKLHLAQMIRLWHKIQFVQFPAKNHTNSCRLITIHTNTQSNTLLLEAIQEIHGKTGSALASAFLIRHPPSAPVQGQFTADRRYILDLAQLCDYTLAKSLLIARPIPQMLNALALAPLSAAKEGGKYT